VVSKIRRQDPWAIGSFLLWTVIMLMGGFPEFTFAALRDAADVLTQYAWVNSPMTITVGFAVFLGVFSWRRAIESNVPNAAAQANGVQMALNAFVGFLPVAPMDFLGILTSGDMTLIAVIWGVGLVKAIAWAYIYSLLFRYYVLHQYKVFGGMGNVFPSGKEDTPTGETGYEKSDSAYDHSAK